MMELFSSDKAVLFRFLVGVFMCLMLPFASLFLYARVRNKLGTRGVIAGLILLLVIIPVTLAVVAPSLLKSPYIRFTEKDQHYYAEIAGTCDLLLRQHTTFYKHSEPLSQQHPKTDFLWMDTNNVVWDMITLSGRDPTLPKAIRALHPNKILISPNRACICIGVRPDYTIIWVII
jgi:hypothetical protein